MRSAIAVALALLLATDCTERERANPLDPDNPITAGAPVGLKVVTNRDSAWVEWTPFDVDSLAGYQVYRWTPEKGPAAYGPPLSPAANHFQEFNLDYDQKYYYAVKAITQTDTSAISAPDSAILGLHNFWIADYSNSVVKRVTYDGSHLIGQVYIDSPVALAAEQSGSRFWVVDYWERAVRIVNRNLQVVMTISPGGWPIDLALSSDGQQAYILQLNPDTIVVVDQQGTTLGGLIVPGDLGSYSRLALDEVDSLLWLAWRQSSGRELIYRTELSANPPDWQLVLEADNLGALEADPFNGGIWTILQDSVIHLSPEGDLTTFAPGVSAYDISLNAENGDCYFIGRYRADNVPLFGRISGGPAAPQVELIDLPVDGLTRLQVLAGSGPVGFLAWGPAEGELLRFDATGKQIGRLAGAVGLEDMALE
ncbi:MAG: hypothetical protein IH972_02845 [Candidatus Marinimicrobia bacterium]|nr:hypothetical protein [Candidatus Neomarinimicrobiota bacterium]